MGDLQLASLREEEYQKLYEQVGPNRFEKAVDGSLRWHATGFFPSMGEFLRFVPEPPPDDSLDKKIAKWKAEYEAVKDDPDYQAELALLKKRFRQLTRCGGGE
jgi:hypothetical protein